MTKVKPHLPIWQGLYDLSKRNSAHRYAISKLYAYSSLMRGLVCFMNATSRHHLNQIPRIFECVAVHYLPFKAGNKGQRTDALRNPNYRTLIWKGMLT